MTGKAESGRLIARPWATAFPDSGRSQWQIDHLPKHLWNGVQEGDVNLSDLARFSVHKIIGFGEQSTAKRADAAQDRALATSLIAWRSDQGRVQRIQDAWQAVLNPGPDWRRHATAGSKALERRHPAQAITL